MATKSLSKPTKSLPEIGEMLETENGALVSGFSTALSPGQIFGGVDPNLGNCSQDNKECTNNCNGGNCVTGCGGTE